MPNGTSHRGSAKWRFTQEHSQSCRQAGEQCEAAHQAWFHFFLAMPSALSSIQSGQDVSRSHSTTWYVAQHHLRSITMQLSAQSSTPEAPHRAACVGF